MTTTINKEDLQKIALEQISFHKKELDYWQLIFNAGEVVNDLKDEIVVSNSYNIDFLNNFNQTVNKYGLDLRGAKDWYDLMKTEGYVNSAFPSFFQKLKELAKEKQIAYLEVPKVPNEVKYWYGSIDCYENNKLKKDLKLKIEDKIKNWKRNK